MKKAACLLGALTVSLFSLSCQKLQARSEIKEGNNAYSREDWGTALRHYARARQLDASFPELGRMVAYCHIGLYVPDDKTPANEAHADAAINELSAYLKKEPDDRIARDALINMYLNSNRTSQAIQYFVNYLRDHPTDLEAVKSVATLYARQGDFAQALNWYEKITLLDSKNPESFYIFGVVLYEKVAKNPPADDGEKMALIEKGKGALERAIQMKPDYFESMAYLNLLWRQQAIIDAKTDPVKAQADIAQADAIRNRAMEIIRQKKAAQGKKS